MTRILLGALVAAMLALTGLVAYNSLNTPPDHPPTTAVTVTATDDSPSCCDKNATEEAGCPFCAAEKAKGGCCGGDAAVKPGVCPADKGESKVEAKKE
ncbi:MAG TPA: hypothetical protein VGF55_00380 [Gemmataceae bacterium]|jgi:hypothetical protein